MITVDSVAATSLTIDDGSGVEAFAEADTVTYSTIPLLAARIAALINLSGTLSVTATHNPGDAFFEINADVVGTTVTVAALINVTRTEVREFSFAITDLVGGQIIDDLDVV